MPLGTVCLTFDFDAVSNWIWSGQTSPGSLSRGEFGVHAIPRLLDLLASRNIESTFFIPGHTIHTFGDACREIVDAGHEVGLHGYLHEPVGSLAAAEERAVFQRAYSAVSDLTGTAPQGSRTPSWDFSANTVDIMVELGLLYDSSLMSQDYTPFFCRQGDRVEENGTFVRGPISPVVELPVSWSLDDYPHFEFVARANRLLPGLRSTADVFSNWTDDIVYMVRDFDDGVAIVTFHPQVIGRGHRLLALERWIDTLRQMGVAFERCDRIARRFVAGRPYGTYRPGQGSRKTTDSTGGP